MQNRRYSAAAQSASARTSGTAQPNGWDAAGAQPQVLHVITLVSSTAPVPLRAPKAPELAGLSVFRSRRVEDGRERFRLHVGYFASASDAERLLPIVRDSYPAAFVSPAPVTNLGSLEDTAIARFSILKPVEPAADATPQIVAPQPAPAPAPVQLPSRATPVPTPLRSEAPLLSAADVVTRAPTAVSPPPRTGALEPDARPAQRYAVQLIWSKTAIDLAKVSSLAIFDGYLLYAVETEPGGRRMYGVRLGFYADALSARLVAQYVRSEFKGVSVVPVSAREVSRASSAVIRLTGSRGHRGDPNSRTRWPQSAVPVEFAPPAEAGAAVSL